MDSATVSGDGRWLITVGSFSDEPCARVWDLSDGRLRHVLPGSGYKHHVAITPDGTRVLYGSGEMTQDVDIWDIVSGRRLHTLVQGVDSYFPPLITPDGKRAITASRDGRVYVNDLARGRELLTLTGHTRALKAAAISADSVYAATGDWDDTLRVWDLRDGTAVLRFAAHHDIHRIVWVPGSSPELVVGTSGGDIMYLEMAVSGQRTVS